MKGCSLLYPPRNLSGTNAPASGPQNFGEVCKCKKLMNTTMPGFKIAGLPLAQSVVSRFMTLRVAWTVGYNLLISMMKASRYGIFELMLVKSVASTEFISVISFARHSGCLSSSINDQQRFDPRL